jgi:hypothetical protein
MNSYTKLINLKLALFMAAFSVIGIDLLLITKADSPDLRGDLDNNNIINVSDISILLSNYGTNNVVADLDGDGKVNAMDLSVLLRNYSSSANIQPHAQGQ